MCKLTDFNAEELALAESLFRNHWKDSINALVRAESIWGEGHENTRHYAREINLIERLLVQVVTASHMIKKSETVNAN